MGSGSTEGFEVKYLSFLKIGDLLQLLVKFVDKSLFIRVIPCLTTLTVFDKLLEA